jgi:fluoride exporter
MIEFSVAGLWIALGSAFGGMARFLLSGLVARSAGEDFPWGTLAVNVSGAAGIGVAAACADAGLLEAWPRFWPMLVVGFLASYTTVSAVSVQTLALARGGARGHAAANVALSVVLCLGAATAGYAAAGTMLSGAAQ